MNAKEIILIFMMFFIMLLILTIPLWGERALPYLKEYLNSATDKLEIWYVYLKFISGRLAEDFMRFLERYVLKSH